MNRPKRLPKYVKAYVDRHGKARYYTRFPGLPAVALPGVPWSAEFMAAHAAATDATKKPPVGASKIVAKSLGDLTTRYLADRAFARLAPDTQRGYRRLVAWLQTEHGHRLVPEMRRRHVHALLNSWRDRRSDHNRLLTLLRQLLAMAVRLEWIETNPVQEFKKEEIEGSYRRWTEAEIEKFETHWVVGTKQRLAFDLLLHTGQRSRDVRFMGLHNIVDGRIVVRQSKTGKEVKPPITPALRASLDTVPEGQLLFVVTARGKPYGGSAFSVLVKAAAAAAGLPADCTAHGLRKSMTCRLAEAGCSAPEIMSITGHSLKEAQRYIDEVDRARLATAAMKRVGASLGEKREQKVSNSGDG